jgi:pyridoxal phosphate enzyme (YggS family)
VSDDPPRSTGVPEAVLLDRLLGNLHAVRERIAAVGRDDVRIVAVTKRHPLDVVRVAAAAGLHDVGENYAQELVGKADAAAGLDLRWHFIGRLQSNKVRSLAGRVALYQTVDRPSLAAEIARRDPGAAVLVQVDLAGLPDRGGCAWTDVDDLVSSTADAGLDVRGLMGVAPPADGPGGRGAVRQAFERLGRVRDDLGLPELSIGMSGDLDEALAAGATMVRLGTVLFGLRSA